MKDIFTRRLWLLFGLVPMFQVIMATIWISSSVEVDGGPFYGVNKTVGWAWDIRNFAPVFAFAFAVVAFLGYGFIAAFKIGTNLLLSILQLALFLPTLFWWWINSYVWLLILLCVVIFPINLVLSIFIHYKKANFAAQNVA